MEITLYKTRSDRKSVTKSVTDGVTRSVTLKGSYQVETPVFMLSRGDNEYFNGYNYLYCKELNSWYYAELTLMPGNMVQIACSIDALMTHRDEIYGLNCMIERQEFVFNPYINDSMMPVSQGSIIEAIDVGAVGDNSRTMYLTCIGGIEA